jgi:hypothetical protein
LADPKANSSFHNRVNNELGGSFLNVLEAISKRKYSELGQHTDNNTVNMVPDSNLIVDNGWEVNAFGSVKELRAVTIANLAN